MNSKHYLVLSGIVGGVIGSLLTALLVPPVTAQRDKFGEIECTKLTVVDEAGKGRIILTTDFKDVLNRNRESNVIIKANEVRSSLHVIGKEGENGAVSIYTVGRSGAIDVYDDSGESMVSLGGRSLAGLAESMEKNGETAPPDLRELMGYVEVYSKGNANGRFQAFPDGASVRLGYRGKDAYEVGGGSANLVGGQDTGGALELNYNIPFEKNIQSSQLDLGVNEEGGYVGMKSKKDKGKVAIGFADHGGYVNASGKDGKLASLSIGEHGGYVTALSKDDTIASLGIDEHGGRVEVFGKGEGQAVMGIGEHGAYVTSLSKDGKAALGAYKYGGFVSAYDKDGKSSARLGVDEYGGQVSVSGEGEGEAVMGINEYGNGAVSTWDKNGYRQK